VTRRPGEIDVDYAVFPLSYTPFSSVRNGLPGSKYSELVLDKKRKRFRYAGPALGSYDIDGQDPKAQWIPDRLAEAAFYQAVAYVVFLGIPVVFESSDAGQHPDVFARTFVRHSTGVYRAYPSFIQLIQTEQLTLLLNIANFSATRLHELVRKWRDEMLNFCPEREIEVRYFPVLLGPDFERCVSRLRFTRGSMAIAETAVPACVPKGFIDLGPDELLWPYKSVEFLAHARNVAHMPAFSGSWGLKIATLVDIGQVASTMAIASQITGALFCDGAPGSVKIQTFRDDQSWTMVSLKTRNKDSVMANALVFAVAFSISNVVVIPAALPVDALLRPLRLACERAADLLMSPGFRIMQAFKPKRILLVSPDATRDMEGTVAVGLINGVITEMGGFVEAQSRGSGQQEPENVIHTTQVHTVITTILDSPFGDSVDKNQLRNVLVGFAVANDYAEYLGLDTE
jgi:hypothetical protein